MQDKTLSEEFDAYSLAVISLVKFEYEADKLKDLLANFESQMEDMDPYASEDVSEMVLADLDLIEEEIEIHTDFIEAFEAKTTASQRAELFAKAVEDNAYEDRILQTRGGNTPKSAQFNL